MRNAASRRFAVLLYALLFCGSPVLPNVAHGQTQMDLNETAGARYAAADKELNAVYDAIRQRNKDDPAFLESLRASQRAWIRFRDAEMKALFPHEDEPGYYGSVLPMCRGIHLEALTRERTKRLRVWLDGVEEGEVCAGSVPDKKP